MLAAVAVGLGGVVMLVSNRERDFEVLPFVALLYLVVGGSLIAFTAYVWLLGRMPPVKS